MILSLEIWKVVLELIQLQACQYFIKGLAGLCRHWNESTDLCKYVDNISDEEDIDASRVSLPSGYNAGKCDYLGRRHSCNSYETGTVTNPDTEEEESNEDLDVYWCIAPNMFLSGLGNRTDTGSGAPLLTAIPKSEIEGYCEGRCDEFGRGTTGVKELQVLLQLFVVIIGHFKLVLAQTNLIN